MEVIKCSRCGSFYINKANVCSNCTHKDNLELAQFKNFIEENGNTETYSISQVSSQTGILESNLNRFLTYDGFKGYKQLFQ